MDHQTSNAGQSQQRPATLATADLGARIVAAAKLAVSMHLYQSTLGLANPSDSRRQVTIGGAGPTLVTDDSPPTTAARQAAGRR